MFRPPFPVCLIAPYKTADECCEVWISYRTRYVSSGLLKYCYPPLRVGNKRRLESRSTKDETCSTRFSFVVAGIADAIQGPLFSASASSGLIQKHYLNKIWH